MNMPTYPDREKNSFANPTRKVVAGSWMLIAMLSLLSLTPISLPTWALYLPFLVSFVLIGLPHGAVDHLVLIELRGQRLSLDNLFKAIVPYLFLAGLYFVLWWIAPAFSFLVFILITWFHWGQGDLYSLSFFTGRDHLTERWHLPLALVIRGGLPMLIPLLAFPDMYKQVALDVTGNLAGYELAGYELAGYGYLFSGTFRIKAGLLFAALVVVYLAATFSRRPSWYADAMETGLLTVFFSLVNPALAIGIYFCCWHGIRHILRITRIDGGKESISKKEVQRFVLNALPTTLAALSLLGGLYYLVPSPPKTLPQFIGLYLILIAVLTLPHIWVVCLMDAKERIWAFD